MFNIYADADPEEMVTVGGQAVSLRTAVRRYIAAREETLNTTGIVVGVVAREVGKIPGSLIPADMDILAELERFR